MHRDALDATMNVRNSPISTMAAQDAHPFLWHDPGVDDKNFRLHGHGLAVLIVVTFSITLLFFVLILFLKWACRCPSSADGPGTPPASGPGPSELDADVIKSVPVVRVRRGTGQSADDDGGQCSICLGVPAEGDKVKVLPGCSHTYHPDCIDEWLRTRSSCPLCRAPLGGSKADGQ